jgi:HAD superfamily hydrolase (TIGR01509 family)
MALRGLIFDFDGLVLDTEGAVYQAWQELYREHGFELSFDAWATIIGTTEAHFDPLENLQNLLGRKVDTKALRQREQREQALIQLLPLLPGVEPILQEAHRLGLKVGLASSSPCRWVEGHLSRLELIGYFEAIRASDDVQRTKPDPELYLAVLQALGLQPDRVH